jgi:hypothetical protein
MRGTFHSLRWLVRDLAHPLVRASGSSSAHVLQPGELLSLGAADGEPLDKRLPEESKVAIDEAFVRELEPRLRELPAPALVSVMMKLASAGAKPSEAFLASWGELVALRAATLDAKALTAVIWALSKLELGPPHYKALGVSFFVRWADACSENVGLFSVLSTKTVLVALGRMRVNPSLVGEDLLSALADRMIRPECGLSDLIVCCWALAQLQAGPPLSLFQRWAGLVQSKLADATPRDLLQLIVVLRRLQLGESDLGPKLFASWARQTVQHWAKFSVHERAEMEASVQSLRLSEPVVGAELLQRIEGSANKSRVAVAAAQVLREKNTLPALLEYGAVSAAVFDERAVLYFFQTALALAGSRPLLRIADKARMRRACDLMQPNLQQLQPLSLSAVMHTLGALDVKPADTFALAWGNACVARGFLAEARDLASVLAAQAALELGMAAGVDFFREWSRVCEGRLHTFAPQELRTTIVSLGVLGVDYRVLGDDRSFLREWGKHCRTHLEAGAFDVHAVAQITVALVRLNAGPLILGDDFFVVWAAFCLARVHEYDASLLVNAMQVLGTLRVQACGINVAALLQALVARCELLPEFTPAQLVVLLEAMADLALGSVVPHKPVPAVLVDACSVANFSAHELHAVMRSLLRLGLGNSPLAGLLQSRWSDSCVAAMRSFSPEVLGSLLSTAVDVGILGDAAVALTRSWAAVSKEKFHLFSSNGLLGSLRALASLNCGPQALGPTLFVSWAVAFGSLLAQVRPEDLAAAFVAIADLELAVGLLGEGFFEAWASALTPGLLQLKAAQLSGVVWGLAQLGTGPLLLGAAFFEHLLEAVRKPVDATSSKAYRADWTKIGYALRSLGVPDQQLAFLLPLGYKLAPPNMHVDPLEAKATRAQVLESVDLDELLSLGLSPSSVFDGYVLCCFFARVRRLATSTPLNEEQRQKLLSVCEKQVSSLHMFMQGYLSVILYSLAMVGVPPQPPFWRAWLRAFLVPHKMARATPGSLTCVVWAMAKLGLKVEETFWEQWASSCVTAFRDCTLWELVTIIWALASLQVPLVVLGTRFVTEWAKTFERWLHSCDSNLLGISFWSWSKLGLSVNVLGGPFFRHCAERLKSFRWVSPHDLSEVLMAIRQLKLTEEHLGVGFVQELAASTIHLVPRMSTYDLSKTVWAISRMEIDNATMSQFMDLLVRQSMARFSRFYLHELALLMNGLDYVRHRTSLRQGGVAHTLKVPPDFFQLWGQRAMGFVGGMKPAHLMTTIYGIVHFGCAQQLPPGFCEKWLRRMMCYLGDLKTFGSKELGFIIYACGVLRLRPILPDLFVLRWAADVRAHFDGFKVGMSRTRIALWGLVNLQLLDCKPHLLDGAELAEQLRAWLDELDRHDPSTPLPWRTSIGNALIRESKDHNSELYDPSLDWEFSSPKVSLSEETALSAAARVFKWRSQSTPTDTAPNSDGTSPSASAAGNLTEDVLQANDQGSPDSDLPSWYKASPASDSSKSSSAHWQPITSTKD